MNRSVTLSAKGVLVALVSALALLVAYLLGNGGSTAQAAPQAPAVSTGSGHARTLVMTGTGRTVGVPDELSFSVSVGLVRPDLATALADANATMKRVLTSLASSGVQRSDVQTTGLSMNAVYDYHSSGPPTLRGYRVSQRAQVLVRDLSKGGAAVTAAVHAGGNDVRVGSLGLRIADPEALLAKSRAAAVKEATAKAQEYADATGQTLGDVLSLREVHASAPVVRMQALPAASFDALKGAALPIRAGKDKLAVTVRIEWSFA
ncbi:SIMPL domain-containing protein [Nocardioides cynanchi]|uniref:SIMPL domain-containing protein n=1 Tax=Nocardioides cynanchi TaxID=2558918 RepID=UPI001244097D|nr:SIMPL domain-containing protein [Nocardioides cynanchi]